VNVNLNAQKARRLVRAPADGGRGGRGGDRPFQPAPSYRNTLTVVSAVLLAVDRYLADPSTGNPPPPSPPPTG